MKTKQITIDVYEVGDVVDIFKVKSPVHKHTLSNGSKAVVIDVFELKHGGISYNVITDNRDKVRIKPEEMTGAVYIGHIDLSLLFDDQP